MSPTQLTLKYLRDVGFTAQVVERWNMGAKKRVDLFGVIDILAIAPHIQGCVGIQACAGGSHSKRLAKILDEPRAKLFLECGNHLRLMSWSKRGARGKRKLWTLRADDITLLMFNGEQKKNHVSRQTNVAQ